MEFTDSMNPELLERTLRSFVTPEGRAIGTQGNKRARRFIIDRLKKDEIGPYSDGGYCYPYGNSFIKGAESVNIVARIPGSKPNERPILIGAHYDTCGPNPGADDNAATVAILLHISPLVTRLNLKRDVIVAFFDAEELPNFLQPTMGSIRFYEDQRTGPVHAAIILDLVGHDVPVPGLEDLLFITGAESDPGLDAAIRQSEPEVGLRTVPTLNSYVGDLSDQHVFRKNERPYLLLTCGRWEHYHASTDTPDILNMSKIEAMANYVITLTELLSDSILDGPFNGNETLSTEIYFLEKNVMPTLRSLGMSLPLTTRADIDRLVTLLMSRFGL